MKIYFQSIFNDNQEEIGYQFNLENIAIPNIEVESFKWGKIKLKLNEETIFWSSSSDDYWGNWILKNNLLKERIEIIRPIKSREIEEINSIENGNTKLNWCKFFLSELEKENSIFKDGKWMILPMKLNLEKDTWNYNSPKFPDSKMSGIRNLEQIYKQPNPQWCEFERYNTPIPINQKSFENSGRVKYWRKRAKENSLPPILMYHISSTNNSIILDGHDRLQASILEQIPPEIITIYQYKEQERQIGLTKEQIKKKEKSIIEQFEKYKKMGIPKLNDLLIRTHENRPFFVERTTASFNKNSEIWNNEILEFIRANPELDKIENMVERRSE